MSRIGFSSACVLPPSFLPRRQSILWGGYSSLNRTTLQCLAASCSCYPAQLDLNDAYNVFDWLLHSASWAALTADHFVPDFISEYAFRMTSSPESFITIWGRTFLILNSSTSEDIGSCRFPELVYKPTFKKQGGTPNHLRRYLLLYCWIRSTQDSAISYICKGHKIRDSRPCC